jgi:hypothetical protein
MRLAIHFDPSDKHYFGPDFDEAVFRALLTLRPERIHVRVRHGNLLYDRLDGLDPALVAEALISDDQPAWALSDSSRLIRAVELHPWVVGLEGLERHDARRITKELSAAVPEFLGVLVVDLGNPVHWMLYRATLPLAYRVYGRELRILHNALDYSVLDEDQERWESDQRDHGMADHWRSLGLFGSVSWENVGLEDTIFDDLHTYDQASRAAQVESALSGEVSLLVTDSLLRCETLDPLLSDALHAAVDSFQAAQSTEQLPHVALSCRRFLERLANALYPPGPDRPDGRKVGPTQYRNRLWAWIEDHLGGTSAKVALANLQDLGDRLDRVDELANKGLHATVDQRDVRRLLVTLVVVASDLLALTPPPPAAELAPYAPALEAFVAEMREQSAGH